MSSTQIVLNIHGGLIQDIFCSEDSVDIVIADWDVEAGNPSERPHLLDVQFAV